ncbi:helix-turn-helix domain-containing protein [Mangrovimonas futianensis]|uniref:helix-turn-helix domain-containing protein n=1 Tax=Mangrovimonas futianensis TaxID=2895523 RepID=UPI001E4CF2E3|nr:helix-turn-helix domain-containing protein [Mangrovimonas futianensis]MCF1420318.1 helix-turn-helix domain-containing protein [Mangrovimonas futianensis]
MAVIKHPFQDSINKITQRLEYLIKQVELKTKLSQDNIILDNADVLQLFKISSGTAANWRDEGILAYSKINNKFYYKLEDIQNLIDSNYQPAKKKD